MYSHTSLGPAGDALVASFTEEFYGGFMRDWEARLNHYLRTASGCVIRMVDVKNGAKHLSNRHFAPRRRDYSVRAPVRIR